MTVDLTWIGKIKITKLIQNSRRIWNIAVSIETYLKARQNLSI